jgi:ubiquitin-like modifier-activating enzyme ATG7
LDAWRNDQKDNEYGFQCMICFFLIVVCSCGFFIASTSGDNVSVSSLSSFNVDSKEDVTFGFVDPCPLAKNPGWPLRNFIALIYSTWKLSSLRILCLRSFGPSDRVDSIVLKVEVPENEALKSGSDKHDFTGWEPNAKGEMGPRLMDLGAVMDPVKLIDTSVDLNIRLMRWRLLPSLEVDKIGKTKCLIIGAGTLGCNVGSLLLVRLLLSMLS